MSCVNVEVCLLLVWLSLPASHLIGFDVRAGDSASFSFNAADHVNM